MLWVYRVNNSFLSELPLELVQHPEPTFNSRIYKKSNLTTSLSATTHPHDLLSGRQFVQAPLLDKPKRTHVFLTECDSVWLPIPLQNTTRLTARMKPCSLFDQNSACRACWNSAVQATEKNKEKKKQYKKETSQKLHHPGGCFIEAVWQISAKLTGKKTSNWCGIVKAVRVVVVL